VTLRARGQVVENDLVFLPEHPLLREGTDGQHHYRADDKG
jgi:hypothetical protein